MGMFHKYLFCHFRAWPENLNAYIAIIYRLLTEFAIQISQYQVRQWHLELIRQPRFLIIIPLEIVKIFYLNFVFVAEKFFYAADWKRRFVFVIRIQINVGGIQALVVFWAHAVVINKNNSSNAFWNIADFYFFSFIGGRVIFCRKIIFCKNLS